MSLAPPLRRTQRVRHDVKRRDVEVVGVQRLSPHFVSITFAGPSLADFSSLSFDDHVKFNFIDGSGEPVRRDYTPRYFDAARGELTIEFVVHGVGAASTWASKAKAGDQAVIAGPKSSMIIPTDYDWHLLVGDATALPAIHRRLEELPLAARVFAIIHVDDAADRRSFERAASTEVQWASSLDDLVSLTRAFAAPTGEGFAWCAGEASVMTELRDLLLVERMHPREAARIAAYWRKDGDGGHEVLA